MTQSTSEQELELRKIEIEAAREEHAAAGEEERESESEVMEKKMEQELELEELEIEATRILDGRNITENVEQEFPEISTNEDVTVYLQSVERLFIIFEWPKSIWATKIALKFRGKDLEAFASMDEEQLSDFDAVKSLQLINTFDETESRVRQEPSDSKEIAIICDVCGNSIKQKSGKNDSDSY
ncbi:Uncharacterised protein r2_g4285 [Pycnogonum litorale]